MSFQVFISYSHHDREWVQAFENALRKLSIRVLDITETNPGDLWVDTLQKALRESEYVIPIVSNETVKSNYAAAELGAALALGKRLIPIVDKDVSIEELPGPIRLRQYLIKDDPERVASQVAKAIEQSLVVSEENKNNGANGKFASP